MTVFDMITEPPEHLKPLADAINNRYFTIDTADLIAVHEWINFNPRIVTYAVQNDDVFGFFNVTPLTSECAALFEKQAIKEEDLEVRHILPPESYPHAQSAYLAAIATHDTRSYHGRQCAAALVSAMASHFLYCYDIHTLKRIYVNPTTFNGNHMVRKLGLRPLISHKKPLKGNDIYVMDITPESIEGLRYFSTRYAHLIGETPWKAKS